MKLSVFERFAWIEVFLRVFAQRHPRIKRMIKSRRKGASTHNNGTNHNYGFSHYGWKKLQSLILEEVDVGDIVLVHSSMDGLAALGVSESDCLEFLKGIIELKKATIVIPSFPVSNLKPPSEKSRPYDPHSTLCWTGLLPNLFISDPECVRSRFPYNSLAAIGPRSKEMMSHDLDGPFVYGINSPWRFCYDNHAKILFLGVKASISNTMAIHMIPDLMNDDWPVDNWYETLQYKVRLNNEIETVLVTCQRSLWYQYVMEEGTSGKLKKNGFLIEQNVDGCTYGFVEDCHKMADFLVSQARKDRLPYLIPHRFYKKK